MVCQIQTKIHCRFKVSVYGRTDHGSFRQISCQRPPRRYYDILLLKLLVFKYVADPAHQLPELVYWLMGTLSRSNAEQLIWISPLMLLGLAYLTLSGKTIYAMSQGDDEAQSLLGIESRRVRLMLIGVATLVCSLSVILAGVIQ